MRMRTARRSLVAGAMTLSAAAAFVTPAGATTVPGTPGTPENPRISDGPYAGYQLCSGPTAPVVTNTRFATLAASVTPSAGDPFYPFPSYPEMNGRYELARPGSESDPFLRKTERVLNGRVFTTSTTQLPDGQYRWRVRAEHKTLVSSWTAWCTFTVRAAM